MGFELSHISFCYDGKKAISELSTSFSRGRFYGVVGPNGCGKTTLMDLICGHKTPDSGKITFNERNIRNYSKGELARQIALVPQDYNINFPFTTEEIVMMGRYPHMPRFSAPSDTDRMRVKAIMAETDTLKFARRNITELSGGERQRVVFARALAQDTDVLVLDEATSNFDIHHCLKLLDIAAGRVSLDKKTVIAVFQDINLAASYCQDLLFLKDGRLVEKGPLDKTLTPENIKDVFDVEANVFFDDFSNAMKVVFKKSAGH